MAKKNKDKAPATNIPTQPGGNTISTGYSSEQAIKKSKTNPNTAGLTPDQVMQLQLEESIKESQNPSMKLKKLRSPLSLRGCITNAILFVVLTLLFGFLYIRFFSDLDKFNLWTIIKDIFQDFGITDFFKKIFTAIGNFFRGNKGGEEIIKHLI